VRNSQVPLQTRCSPESVGSRGGARGMMAGWAYLMGAIMTIDALLLGLLLMNVKWPRRSNRE